MAGKVTSTILRVYLLDQSAPGKEEGIVKLCNEEGGVTQTEVQFDKLENMPQKIRELLEAGGISWPRRSPDTIAKSPLEQSQAAFESELPDLLQHHRGEWVAYADGKLVRFGRSQAELYRHCLTDLKLTHDRFVVRRIMPEGGNQIEYSYR